MNMQNRTSAVARTGSCARRDETGREVSVLRDVDSAASRSRGGTMRTSTSRWTAAASGAVLIGIGLAAPAFAEGYRDSYMNDWHDGDTSSNWKDNNEDSYNGRVTFRSCTREFRATVRRVVSFQPDKQVGSEWIDCRSYSDAVYVGDVSAGTYHFDVSGMGFAWCSSGQCAYNLTDVPDLRISW